MLVEVEVLSFYCFDVVGGLEIEFVWLESMVRSILLYRFDILIGSIGKIMIVKFVFECILVVEFFDYMFVDGRLIFLIY